MTTILFAVLVWFSEPEQHAVSAWLRLNPKWTPVERERCSDSEALARQEERVAGYHPFRARGDFNLDGFSDVAVVVESDTRLALLVLNGAAGGTFRRRRAAFLPLGVEIARANLGVAKNGTLLVGLFESDVFFYVEPANGSYVLVANDTSDYP